MTQILHPSKENDSNIKRLGQSLGKLDEALAFFSQNSLYDYEKMKHKVGSVISCTSTFLWGNYTKEQSVLYSHLIHHSKQGVVRT